jgi:hypothetical protein
MGVSGGGSVVLIRGHVHTSCMFEYHRPRLSSPKPVASLTRSRGLMPFFSR